MGLDLKQFREYVTGPTLNYLGLYSKSAENLLIGTALQESRLSYIDQTTPGPGPAYGIYQIERATHDDLWENFLKYKPDLASKIMDLMAEVPTDACEQLRTNLAYATAMCRVFYLRVPEALPPEDNIVALAKYWKKYYNTYLGKGKIEEFVANYRR